MNHRHIYHRFAHTRVPLLVLAQPAITHEPTERPLHHPTLGQHRETYCPLHPAHHLQHPAIDDPDTPERLLASIAAIRPNLLQTPKAFFGLVQHGLTAVLILDIGRMDHAGDPHSQDIDQDVPLATADFLAAIVAPFAAALGSLDRLAVEDGRGRRSFLTGLASNRRMQRVVDTQPQAVLTPAAEIGSHRTPGREVVG